MQGMAPEIPRKDWTTNQRPLGAVRNSQSDFVIVFLKTCYFTSKALCICLATLSITVVVTELPNCL